MNIPETLSWGEMDEQQRTAVRMWFALGLPVEMFDSEGGHVSPRWVNERFKDIIARHPSSVLVTWRFRLKPDD